MDQVVSRRSLFAKAWVRAQVSPCGRQSDTGTRFFPTSLVFHLSISPWLSIHTYTYISPGDELRPIRGRSSDTSSNHTNMNHNNNKQLV
jgi:hypothetical protein